MKHILLFVAANPFDTERLGLDEECAAIEREIRMTPARDDFEFRAKWAVSVDDLMRHLNELQPTILHFSGHGSAGTTSASHEQRDRYRDVQLSRPAGIFLQERGNSHYASERALARMIASASPATRVIVLNACYSAAVAESLRHEAECVVGMTGSLSDDAARSFAVAFYRALGNHRSVGNALAQAVAVLDVKQQADARPICATRDGIDPDNIYPFIADEDRAIAPPGSVDRTSYLANDRDEVLPRHDGRAGTSRNEERAMTHEELLTRLSKLLPGQFEHVLYVAGIPHEHLPAASAAQALRAVEVMRYVEQQNQLQRLARIVLRVIAGDSAGPDRRQLR